jgi:hypothetical protein
MAWRTGALRVVAGELERRVSTTFVWDPDPVLRPLCVGPTLVRDGNYSCKQVVGDGDFSCEQVIGGETESTL